MAFYWIIDSVNHVKSIIRLSPFCLLSRGLISDAQIKRYKEEINQRALFDERERQAVLNQVFDDLPFKIKMEMIELVGQAIQKMAPEKQKIVLEKLIVN